MRTGKKGAVIATLLALNVLSGCGVNNIPSYEEAAKASWSQVENQYQRRADLIPNLVETVRGYARQEKDVLVGVTEARANVSQMTLPKDLLNNPEAFRKFQASQDALSAALSRLLIVVEKYPDLKSNQNFLALQSQLESTENRVSVARRDFIGAVQRLNTEIRTIPGRWWYAWLYREVKPMESFTASKGAQDVPKVKF